MLDFSTDCGDCRQIYTERDPPEEPPCITCKILPYPENEDALKVFFTVQYQFVVGFNGSIDISHLAIDAAIKRNEITNQQDCFNKVVRLGHWWIERIRAKSE